MTNHEHMPLRDPNIHPTDEMLETILGNSFASYKLLQDTLQNLNMAQEWQWYTPYKAWFAKGQYFWETKRGTKKEKNLYWLYVYEGFFSIAIWFKEKNRTELLSADLSENAKQLIGNGQTLGKLPTFPVVIDVKTSELPGEVFPLLDWKKKLET